MTERARPARAAEGGGDRLTRVETILERVEQAIHRSGNDMAKVAAEAREATHRVEEKVDELKAEMGDRAESARKDREAKDRDLHDRIERLAEKFITRAEFGVAKATTYFWAAVISGGLAFVINLTRIGR